MVNGGFKENDRELDQILNKIDAKIGRRRKTADEILKTTAITLIRGNHIEQAGKVLAILM
jgi:hydroxyethylthiazole kinase-like sugar kinase family protein